MSPEDIPSWVALPGIVMASDSMMVPGEWDELLRDIAHEEFTNLHPRTAGSHDASLRIARQHDIPLMQVPATLSYDVGRHLGGTGREAMRERGRTQEGMVADIVDFDPITVTDNATYANGTPPTTGIPFVPVNGVIVVREGTAQPDTFSGQPIGFPVQDGVHFEPLRRPGSGITLSRPRAFTE